MRVIAGSLRRRTLKEVPHQNTRHTRDMVKENLFNMLGPVSGKRVLDAFAGSGALGIEALSRGADHADFIEHDRAAFRVLETNLKNLGLKDSTQAFKADTPRQLARLDAPYDLILLDPPYNKGLIERTLPLISKEALLSAQGTIALLHSSEESPAIPEAFSTIKTRTYGATAVTLLEWSD